MSKIFYVWERAKPIWRLVVSTRDWIGFAIGIIGLAIFIEWYRATLIWLKSGTTVSNWLFVALPLAAAVTLYGVNWWRRRSITPQVQTAQRFIDVEDPDLKFAWRLLEPVKSWLHADVDRFSPNYIDQSVLGPFHLGGHCMAELTTPIRLSGRQRFEVEIHGSETNLVTPLCMKCRTDLSDSIKKLGDNFIAATPLNLKKQVMREVQRLARLNQDMTSKVTIHLTRQSGT